MKADPAEQIIVLDLQASDAALARLAHRRASLPEIEKLAELAVKSEELERRRVASATRVADLERDQRKADAEVELVRTRKARDEERLNSGVITNPKDLSSLQHELEALDRRIGVLEDAELEVMEALDAAQDELIAIETELAQLATDRRESLEARDAAWAEIDEERTAHEADRTDSAGKISPELFALYDKLRAQYGSGAAALHQRRCEGCRLELNSADLRELATQPDDQVLRCPECSRILVRTSESGL